MSTLVLCITLLALGSFCLWLLTKQARGRGGSAYLADRTALEVSYWKERAKRLLRRRRTGDDLLASLDRMRDDKRRE